MNRRSIGRLAVAVMIITAFVLILVAWSSPRETPTSLGGIGIGDEASGFARISFRRLTCTALKQVSPDPQGIRVDGMRCTTPVASKLLIVEAERFDPHRRIGFRRCTAQYGERTVDCVSGGVTSGGPRYAWISATALGIDAETLVSIRQANPLEQVRSDTWLTVWPLLAGLLSTSLGIALAARFGRSLLTRAAVASASAVMMFPVFWVGVMVLIGSYMD